ncbi:MAG: hypothetical protein Q8Q59_12605 [Luteolibacter sp.]|jgi:hypothetical protein|nr:hypothetical protein [Luteolibacter sp.]
MDNGAVLMLDSRNAEACRRSLEVSISSEVDGFLSRFGGMTLAGMVEYFMLSARHPKAGRMRTEMRRQTSAPWQAMLKAWLGERDEAPPFASPEYEFRKIKPRVWTGNDPGWHLYERRFLSRLREAGFESIFAHGVLKAFAEMAENVVQHSGFDGSESQGLAGYYVGPQRFAFSICDLGCGLLRSLHVSSLWADVPSERDAILAVVYKAASRRSGQGEGEGFKQLWKAFADHGAIARLRSGDATASIRLADGSRVVEVSNIPRIDGVHLSVCCTLGCQTAEKDLDFSLLDH